jgi:hypothetical protein
VVLFKYHGWESVSSFELTEGFQMAANMPVLDVTVSGDGKVARVKFPSEMALLAIFRITTRYFPDFPGVDSNTFIAGHLQTLRVSLNLI